MSGEEQPVPGRNAAAAKLRWTKETNKLVMECYISVRSLNSMITSLTQFVQKEKYKLPWDFKLQTDQRMDHNKPDVVLLNKGERCCLIIDVTCHFDTRVLSKENEKIENYHDLKHEIKRGIWNYRSVQVIPIVIGALGTVTRGFGNWLRHLGML